MPVVIERKGKILKIVLDKPLSKLDRLISRSYVVGDPEELVHMDWSGEWDGSWPP